MIKIVERLVNKLWTDLLGISLNEPFPWLTYSDALSLYGSDKPDIRYSFKICEIEKHGNLVTEALPFQEGSQSPEQFALSSFSEADWKSLIPIISSYGGLFCKGPERISNLIHATNIDPTSLEFMLCAQRDTTDHVGTTLLGRIRNHLIQRLNASMSTKPNAGLGFVWIYDFPLLARADSEQAADRKYESMHHPFTAPHVDDIDLLASEPLAVRGQHYDLVLNGCEVAGGSIRVHSAELQEYLLRHVMRLSDARIDSFAHLLDALRSGCPPHGGIALGLDRMVAIMQGASSIRDVIAFPKNSAGHDLCVNAPN